MSYHTLSSFFFFFNDTATTEIYTLSLHDALPIQEVAHVTFGAPAPHHSVPVPLRSEEHTSELQSHQDLVCRLLLEKKKTREHQTPLLKKQRPTEPQNGRDENR